MDYFRERGVEFWSFEGPPERYGTIEEDEGRLGKWYASVDGAGGKEVIDALDNEHDERIRTLEGMPERTLNSVWWPFTQHGLVSCFVATELPSS
jgi:dethiobiotin synthetase/adenosylmethionine--8-amino-7-oxononanoate aminotransferase